MSILKRFDVVYSTKSGRLVVAKSVMANNAAEAKEKLKKEMRASTSFDKIRLVMGMNASLPNGLRKAVAKTIKVTGLRKSNGTLQKGYKYVKGGKIVKVKAKVQAKKK